MKRLPATPARTLVGQRLIGPVLVTLFFMALLALLIPAQAEARLIIRAQVRLPHVSAVLDTSPLRAAPVRQEVRCEQSLTGADRQIANRLARMTPYHLAAFLDLRRAGYSWREIGRLLDIPQRVMRMALQPAVHRARPNMYR
jgi:DNA-directed RNA polymerase specialized sigma24 family protein